MSEVRYINLIIVEHLAVFTNGGGKNAFVR